MLWHDLRQECFQEIVSYQKEIVLFPTFVQPRNPCLRVHTHPCIPGTNKKHSALCHLPSEQGKGLTLALKAARRTLSRNPSFQKHQMHHPENAWINTQAAEGCLVFPGDREEPDSPAEKVARTMTVAGVSRQESPALYRKSSMQ